MWFYGGLSLLEFLAQACADFYMCRLPVHSLIFAQILLFTDCVFTTIMTACSHTNGLVPWARHHRHAEARKNERCGYDGLSTLQYNIYMYYLFWSHSFYSFFQVQVILGEKCSLRNLILSCCLYTLFHVLA